MAKATYLMYLSVGEKQKLFEAAKQTGVPVNRLLLDSFAYWVKNNPKGLKDLAAEFKGLRDERNAKERERDTGDLLGSFKKMNDKLKLIKEAVSVGEVSPEVGQLMREQTRRNYSLTQNVKIKRVHKRASTKVGARPRGNVIEFIRKTMITKASWCKTCSGNCLKCLHYHAIMEGSAPEGMISQFHNTKPKKRKR